MIHFKGLFQQTLKPYKIRHCPNFNYWRKNLKKEELNLSTIDGINEFREEIERRYSDIKWSAGCGMSFDEILCFELHSQPENPRAFIGQLGLTFRELADKWQISVTSLGILIAHHCDRLSDYGE